MAFKTSTCYFVAFLIPYKYPIFATMDMISL